MDRPFAQALRIVLVSVLLGILFGYGVSELAFQVWGYQLRSQATRPGLFVPLRKG